MSSSKVVIFSLQKTKAQKCESAISLTNFGHYGRTNVKHLFAIPKAKGMFFYLFTLKTLSLFHFITTFALHDLCNEIYVMRNKPNNYAAGACRNRHAPALYKGISFAYSALRVKRLKSVTVRPLLTLSRY